MKRDDYQAFLKLDLSPYSGEWIAICGKQVVSHGKRFEAVFNKAKKTCPSKRPYFAKVPGKEKLFL